MKIGYTNIGISIIMLLLGVATLTGLGGVCAIKINHSPGDVADGWRMVRFSGFSLLVAFIIYITLYILHRKDQK